MESKGEAVSSSAGRGRAHAATGYTRPPLRLAARSSQADPRGPHLADPTQADPFPHVVFHTKIRELADIPYGLYVALKRTPKNTCITWHPSNLAGQPLRHLPLKFQSVLRLTNKSLATLTCRVSILLRTSTALSSSSAAETYQRFNELAVKDIRGDRKNRQYPAYSVDLNLTENGHKFAKLSKSRLFQAGRTLVLCGFSYLGLLSCRTEFLFTMAWLFRWQ